MDVLKTKINTLFLELFQDFIQVLPKFLVAFILIVVGWFLAKLLKSWAARIIGPLFIWVQKRGGKSDGQSIDFEHKAIGLIRHLVFWIVWLFFIVGAIQIVAKPITATGLSLLIRFLPQLLAAILIFLGGWILGSLLQGFAKKAMSSYGSEQARAVGRVAKNVILLLTFLLVFDQLGFRVDLIIQLAIIIAAMLAGSFALAFAFGAKVTIGNMMASYYILKNFKIGQRIRIGDVEGKLMNITRTQVVIDTSTGLVFIPAHDFNEKWVSIMKEL
jgi:hypothetical protein